MTVSMVVVMAAVSAGACKRKESPSPQTTTPPPTTAERKLADGERIWVDGAGRDPGLEWRPGGAGAGETVHVYPVRVADDMVVLRAQRGDKVQDVERFKLRAQGTPKVELRALPNGRALVEYGPVADEGNAREGDERVMLLSWDEQSGEAKVRKRWRGKAVDRRPGWSTSGEADLTNAGLGSCQAVVAKIGKCSGDAAFQDALVDRLDPADRPAAKRTIGQEARGWGEKEASVRQCREWAGEGYEASSLSDEKQLAELERETNLDCPSFARELVDEGGLPRKVVVAGEAKPTTTAEHR